MFKATKMYKFLPVVLVAIVLVALFTTMGGNNPTSLSGKNVAQAQEGAKFDRNVFATNPGKSVTTNYVPQNPGILYNLTQSTNTSTITTFNSVACSSGGVTTANSYWRYFDLSTYGITTNFDVASVDYGIEEVSGTQPIVLNIYSHTGAAFPGGTLTLVGTSARNATSADNATVVNQAVVATIPAGLDLVVEIFSAGDGAGYFYIGSNNLGQSAPSYLSAAGCSVTSPTPTGDLGFPDMHIVMIVNGDDGVSPATATPTTCPISVTSPTLSGPAHRTHTTDTTPSFSWSQVSGAQSYRLMVYNEDRSFEYKKRRVGETSTSYTLQAAEALTPQKYLWRVRTQDTDCGTWTGWSNRNTLFVD